MAPSSSASPSPSPSSTNSPSPPLLPPPAVPSHHHHHPHTFTPIQECEREEQEDEYSEGRSPSKATTPANSFSKETNTPSKHHPTPLHEKKGKGANGKKQRHGPTGEKSEDDHDGSISCNKCRPHGREKISVVPLDNNGGLSRLSSSIPSPNGIFKSIFYSLTRKSPKSVDVSSAAGREEQWKIAVAELSHKLIQATRKRDEAVLEASRLKYSMAELEKKLNKLEVYCHNLKSGLEECSSSSTNSPYQAAAAAGKSHRIMRREQIDHLGFSEKVIIDQFLVLVSESRSSVRLLSRALTMQLRHLSGRVSERLAVLLQPYDVKISVSKNPKSLLFYLEALLNKAFFEDFESVGFQKSSTNPILNPIDRCEANYALFNALKELTWEDVLNKGTRHFSEEFSKFCDRKMNDIVAMLGWNRAWAEPLLQAFFGASKTVWLVHLLANSVHPGLTIFRVDNGLRFDSVYMEETGGDRTGKLVPTMVRIMVAPGFYVYGNVVKSKVLCRYHNYSVSNESITMV